MSFNRKTSLPDSWNVTLEMMEQPECRIPFMNPDSIPEDMREEVEAVYASSLKSLGVIPRFVQILGHSPALVEAWGIIESKVRFAYQKTDPEFLKSLQLAIVKTALLNHSNNCTAHNADLAIRLGFTWEHMDALESDEWRVTNLFTSEQKAAIRWAEVVTNGTAYDDDKVFEELKRHFNTRQIVEITFYCGMWNLSGRITEPFHLTVEPPGERIRMN